jgi:two-component system phosphate regulon sensor histidine kinase PhoR
MSPYVLFWIPSALRLVLIWIGAGVLWYYYGPAIGLVAGLVAMTALVTMQLHYLYQLNIWLDVPESEKLPDGWGAWNAVFARLYRMHREEEKSSTELITGWRGYSRQCAVSRMVQPGCGKTSWPDAGKGQRNACHQSDSQS